MKIGEGGLRVWPVGRRAHEKPRGLCRGCKVVQESSLAFSRVVCSGTLAYMAGDGLTRDVDGLWAGGTQAGGRGAGPTCVPIGARAGPAGFAPPYTQRPAGSRLFPRSTTTKGETSFRRAHAFVILDDRPRKVAMPFARFLSSHLEGPEETCRLGPRVQPGIPCPHTQEAGPHSPRPLRSPRPRLGPRPRLSLPGEAARAVSRAPARRTEC